MAKPKNNINNKFSSYNKKNSNNISNNNKPKFSIPTSFNLLSWINTKLILYSINMRKTAK